jgi:hypothetical protein
LAAVSATARNEDAPPPKINLSGGANFYSRLPALNAGATRALSGEGTDGKLERNAL